MSDNSAGGLVALSACFTGLTVVAVSLRFYLRKYQDVPLRPDDWLMVVAATSYLGSAICMWISVSIKELGYHTSVSEATVTPETRDLLEICVDIFSILCLGCTKCSALYFYKRIFCPMGTNRTFNIVLMSTITIVACWVIVMEFLTGFQCHTHFSALWNGQYAKYCTISYAFLLALSISDVILDVWILSLPIPMVLRLNIGITRKLSTCAVFLIGLAGLGAGIARLAIIVHVDQLGEAGLEHVDTELLDTKIAFYYMLEDGTSLLAVNLITLWPLFSRIGPDAIMRGVRLVSSLGSGSSEEFKGSDQSRTSSDRLPDKAAHQLSSGESPVYDARKSTVLHESYAVAGLDGPEAAHLPDHGIIVKDEVEVISSHGRL